MQVKRRSTQVGRRGAPAKGVGRVTGARVQIPPSPPANIIRILQYMRYFTLGFLDEFWRMTVGILFVFNRTLEEKLVSFPLRYEIAT